jgi:hypothetical protein
LLRQSKLKQVRMPEKQDHHYRMLNSVAGFTLGELAASGHGQNWDLHAGFLHAVGQGQRH